MIVPAHGEAAVIGSCLRSLAGQRRRTAGEVVVVANGCRDATASIARSWRLGLFEPAWSCACSSSARRASRPR